MEPGAARAADSIRHNGSRRRTPRAERALAALRHFAKRDLSWPLPSEAGAWMKATFGSGSPDTFRRGVTELIEGGVVELTGLRTGKARVYRLLPAEGSPQALVESPQPAALDRTAAPLRGVAAVSPRRGGSSQAPEDREWFDGFEWTSELRDDYAARAYELYRRLAFGGEDSAPEPLGAGDCGDCHRDVPRRERYRE